MHNLSLETVREYMRELRAMLASLQLYPRVTDRYPFDHVALEVVSKAFSLAEACLILIEAGHQDEAYGLCRSAVECAFILRHLTSDRDKQAFKTSAFVAYSRHYKNFWTYHVRQRFAGKAQEAAIEAEVKRWNLTGDPEPAIKNKARINTWEVAHSKHPLDTDLMTAENRALHYAVTYFQPSQYVHCSQPALDGFIPDEGRSFALRAGETLLPNIPSRIGLILVAHLYRVVVYALFGMNVTLPDEFVQCYQKALGVLDESDPGERALMTLGRD